MLDDDDADEDVDGDGGSWRCSMLRAALTPHGRQFVALGSWLGGVGGDAAFLVCCSLRLLLLSLSLSVLLSSSFFTVVVSDRVASW